jgi:hypothetical protein
MVIRFAFQGAVRFGEHLELEAAILEELSHDRAAIAGEIAVEIEEVVRARPRVWIEFGRGSIEWFGWVEWVAAAWPTLEALSTVGGAIALVEIVKNGVETVMRRRFNRNSLQQPQLTGTVVAPVAALPVLRSERARVDVWKALFAQNGWTANGHVCPTATSSERVSLTFRGADHHIFELDDLISAGDEILTLQDGPLTRYLLWEDLVLVSRRPR